jgi:uncharacterized protein (TIGR02452 family)
MDSHKTKIINRDRAAELGREAIAIIEASQYVGPSGRVVAIDELVSRAIAGTRSYPLEEPVALPKTRSFPTQITVENDTTLAVAHRLVGMGHTPAALNFASATSPGGGFLSGSRAQEEYLARSTALYACLEGNPMYEYHRSRRDPLYSNYAIYSPAVPVFRADDGTLLETPYCVGIVTSPAVNARRLDLHRQGEIAPAMWQRILKILSIGALHGHDAFVLGAWGCGAFQNDAGIIANLFKKAFSNEVCGVYARVVFAIVDWSDEQRFIGPFSAAFREEKSS